MKQYSKIITFSSPLEDLSEVEVLEVMEEILKNKIQTAKEPQIEIPAVFKKALNFTTTD